LIASVKGRLIDKAENEVVLQIGGIGLQIGVPSAVCSRYEVEEDLKLFTSMIVREDNISLYGFETKEENKIFLHLLRVSGVGPRLALAILSSLTVEQIYQAVVGGQAGLFNQVPGIGSKTAQKIILHINDRLKTELDGKFIQITRDTNSELMEALVGLGYSVVEAQAAIQALPKDIPDELEEKIRLSLRFFTS